jgi:hypothetical protein
VRDTTNSAAWLTDRLQAVETGERDSFLAAAGHLATDDDADLAGLTEADASKLLDELGPGPKDVAPSAAP